MRIVRFIIFFAGIFTGFQAVAQQLDSVREAGQRVLPDTQILQRERNQPARETIPPSEIRIDTQRQTAVPASRNANRAVLDEQPVDTSAKAPAGDSVVAPAADSLFTDSLLPATKASTQTTKVKKTGKVSPYANLDNQVREANNGKEVFFFVMCGLLFFLGMMRSFYPHYFSNLLSVYFNTSLRQNQLSEQLREDKLPSFLLNIFFVLSGGIFVWLIITNSGFTLPLPVYAILEICVGGVAFIYLTKFFFLKFLGWISGNSQVVDRYIFIIFLVNKLLAIALIPFIILMLFGKHDWMKIYVTLALSVSGVLLLSRYIKSYGLLRQNFPMTIFHFLLFFIGAELIPLLVIYKLTFDYLVS